MEIFEEKRATVLMVCLKGRLDTNTASPLEARLNLVLEQGETRFLIDLTGLDYISSAGLRVLLALSKKLQRCQGRVALSGMNKNIKSVFDLTGFSTLFRQFSDVNEALAQFDQ